MTAAQFRALNIFGWQESPVIPGGYRFELSCDYCTKNCKHVRDFLIQPSTNVAQLTLTVLAEAYQELGRHCTPIPGYNLIEVEDEKEEESELVHHIATFQCPKCGLGMLVDIEAKDHTHCFNKHFNLKISAQEDGDNDL